jgi:hypothetical protein
VQSLRCIDPFPVGKCIAHGVGPEVLLSLLPNFAYCEALHYSALRDFKCQEDVGLRRLRSSIRRISSAR